MTQNPTFLQPSSHEPWGHVGIGAGSENVLVSGGNNSAILLHWKHWHPNIFYNISILKGILKGLKKH